MFKSKKNIAYNGKITKSENTQYSKDEIIIWRDWTYKKQKKFQKIKTKHSI